MTLAGLRDYKLLVIIRAHYFITEQHLTFVSTLNFVKGDTMKFSNNR